MNLKGFWASFFRVFFLSFFLFLLWDSHRASGVIRRCSPGLCIVSLLFVVLFSDMTVSLIFTFASGFFSQLQSLWSLSSEFLISVVHWMFSFILRISTWFLRFLCLRWCSLCDETLVLNVSFSSLEIISFSSFNILIVTFKCSSSKSEVWASFQDSFCDWFFPVYGRVFTRLKIFYWNWSFKMLHRGSFGIHPLPISAGLVLVFVVLLFTCMCSAVVPSGWGSVSWWGQECHVVHLPAFAGGPVPVGLAFWTRRGSPHSCCPPCSTSRSACRICDLPDSRSVWALPRVSREHSPSSFSP